MGFFERNNSNNEIINDVKNDIKSDLKKELKDEIEDDILNDLKTNQLKNLKKELKDDILNDLKNDTNINIIDNKDDNTEADDYPYTLDHIDIDDYDYLDFGCSKGNSLKYGRDKFSGKKGLGIDIEKSKVDEAHRRMNNKEIDDRDNAIRADILDLPKLLPKKTNFRFTTCIHFLEHLNGYPFVKEVINTAILISNEFVFIMQPNGDKNVYLFEKGLKTYYSDWTAHNSILTSYDFYRLCQFEKDQGNIKDFIIFAVVPIKSSADSFIHPISSKYNSHDYDSSRHPPKDMNIELEGVYKDIGLFLIIDEKTPVDDYFNKVHGEKKILYDSRKA